MRTLFARAGIDYEQWKAVSRTLVRGDFRPPMQQVTTSYSLRSLRGWILMVVVYGLFGVAAAVISLLNEDVLLTGTVTLTYLAMLVTMALLTQHATAIVSAVDYQILGPLPITSRTFFAIRLTNVLFHALILTVCMGWPPLLAQTLGHGINVLRGVAMAAALLACSVATTFAVVASYGTVLRLVGAARLQRVLGYSQMVVGFLAYAGMIVVLQVIGRSGIVSVSLPRAAWLLFFPPAWYASYLEMANGSLDANVLLRALISVVFIGAMFVLLRGPLAIGYAERIAEIAVSAREQAPRPTPRRSWLFTRDEARAVAILVRAHFRHDMRVRLGILSSVPLTVFYMFLGAREGTIEDPFVSDGHVVGANLMSFAVLFFPTILLQQLSATDGYRGAWIYFATPADRTSLIVAMKNVIVGSFLVPFVLFLAAILAWRFGHVGHALVHAAFLGLVGYLVLQASTLVEPRLPFAAEPKKASGSATLLAWMLISMIGGNILLIALQSWAYETWTRVGLAAAALIGLGWLLNLPLRRRAEEADELPDWV